MEVASPPVCQAHTGNMCPRPSLSWCPRSNVPRCLLPLTPGLVVEMAGVSRYRAVVHNSKYMGARVRCH